MKKLLAMILAAMMIFAAVPTALMEGTEAVKEHLDIAYSNDEITVAVTTPITGNFFTSLWGNNTSDTDVRALLHGYDLIRFDNEIGAFCPDESVVSGYVVMENIPTGNRTYTFSLYHDLTWSDGTPITAWDYAFSVLLTMAPEMEAIGGDIAVPEYLLGYEDYISGKVNYLAGLKVLDDYQLQFVVKGEYLPFFYEFGRLSAVPYPISEIAPEAEVKDDGDGVYFSKPINAAGLKAAVDSYRSNPSVTSGPYKLVSWQDGEAKFELNPQYKGDYAGNKPSIQKITFKSMAQDELLPALKDGSVTILNKLTKTEVIADGVALTEQYDNFDCVAYPRSGLAQITYNTNKAPMDDLNVRQALAQLIDRNAITAQVTGETGLRAEGYYGIGQWMYLLLNGRLELPEPKEGASQEEKAKYEKQKAGLAELKLEDIKPWEVDPEAAAALLDASGWELKDGVRTKDGTALTLKMAYPEGSAAAAALEALPEALKAAGITLTVEAIPMADLLPQYYGYAETGYDLFFMATNFQLLYDLSAGFETADDGSHVWKQTGLADEILYKEAEAMSTTEPGDVLGFCEHWLKFQERFAEVLPLLPIYSNVYVDVYASVLQDYDVAANVSWAEALNAATLGE